MDAVRHGMHSSSIFVVDYLRVAQADGVGIAYAEVHPARENAAQPFTGWVLLKRDRFGWEAIWGVAGGGMNDCRILAIVYRGAIKVARNITTDPTFFSKAFWRDRAEIESSEAGLGCAGDIVKGPGAQVDR